MAGRIVLSGQEGLQRELLLMVVLKGVLDDGEELAVKVLNDNLQETEDQEFEQEFNNIVMLDHPNIVRLVAYCFDTQRPRVEFDGGRDFAESTRRALCFEIMHKGSLEGYLSDESRGLDWKERYKIIRGACEGLKYLHGLGNPVYHLDLKPENILLDEDMTPKLADFGLSKLCGPEQTRITTNVTGTLGYMAPEYLFKGLISNKVDVFSMGVVIIEIIAGPKFQKRSAEMSSDQEFLDQVYQNWRKRLEATCTSPRILDAYCDQVSVCTEMGLRSMDTNKVNRPTIVEIIKRLDETEIMIEKAISWSANLRSSVPAKSQREKHDDLVKVEAFARNKAIHFTDTCDEFPVIVRVTGAPRRRLVEMPAMDVVLVFNVSLYYMKTVMKVLVDRLRPTDRLSILICGLPPAGEGLGVDMYLTYMDLTYMSEHGRNVARLKINELDGRYLRADCCHDPVLPQAAQILRSRGAEESGSRAGCILHIWNSRDSRKILENEDIRLEFPVHSIDIDRQIPYMKRIARLSAGSYDAYARSDFEREPQIILATFFAGLTSVVPRSVTITLQEDEGVTIAAIESNPHDTYTIVSTSSATVHLNSVYAGEQKTFIVYLKVPKGKEKLVTVGGVYETLKTSKELAGFDVVVARPRRKCMPHELVIHPKVAAELLRFRLMERIEQVNEDLTSTDLPLLLDEIKNSDDGCAAPEEILSDLEDEVAEMKDGQVAIFASLSCRQLQRSATKGTPRNIGAFEILRQQREDENNNLVTVKGFARCKAILHSVKCNEFPVLVRVNGVPWHHGWEMPREGVDVVAVLDISRNMQGERLQLVKQSIMIVIDKLGPDDRLSILSCQTRKNRLMELTYMSDNLGHGRDAARFKIAQLKASSEGCTGHMATVALQQGAQILRDRGAEESSGRLGCMILLSDGKYEEILQEEISREFPVHTFGFGADHNPKVMKYVADMTSGTYSFVNQDINNIRDALALFITGVTSIVATSITITLRVHCDIAISSIESGNYIHHVKSDKMSGTIIIDHIYAGEQKEFIVNLIVGNARKELMTIGGQYKSCKRNKYPIAEMDMSVLRPWSKPSPYDLAIHPNVAAELTRIRLQNGVLDMVEAQKMTTQEVQKLWNKVKHSDEGCSAPEETLSGLNMEVAEMNKDISGMPYTLSWLSCHKWQRPTTKGTPNNSRAFRTIGQYADEDTNLVKVETYTRSKAIPSDDPCNKFTVLVRVMAAPRRQAEEMTCSGVDIVAVLDASAGMQGGKLERMKEAMMVVIGKLRALDRLSIVSFNTFENRLTRLTYMTDHGRDVARLKVSKLVAGGQGDIVAALREGDEILRWREAESSRRVGCMLFLSDCKNHEIFETEIMPEFPVHTFGLGTDHNPRIMKYIADITSGTYSFVNQDIGMIKDALALFITGLTSVAAMSIELTLWTNEGITLSSIESGGYINYVENNQLGTIDIDHIYVGEQKDFIVYLRVAEGKKELMTIGGRYLSHNTVKHLAYTNVYVRRPHQEVIPEELAIQPDVAAELVRVMLEKGITTMLEKAPRIAGLQQLWEKIMDTDEARAMPAETLSGLSMDVAEMERDIENHQGLPYMLSWLTSSKWQRATIKGTPSSSYAFQRTGAG
ncbi:hypothetical protein ACQ4PT_054217 [Festuca glaucescens]